VSFGETVLLGALAGFTIYLGLPVGRVGFVSQRAKVALAMFSVGVLAFLFAEVLVHGVEIVEHRFEELGEDEGSLLEALGLILMLGVGFTAGSAGLALIESRMRTPKLPPISGGATDAMTVEQAEIAAGTTEQRQIARAAALRTGMTIAAAIGLHNFAEGLVGGGPVFLGTIVGYNVTSEPLELLFYSVSAGAILYVIGEVWGAMRRLGHRELGLVMLAAGVFLGIATEMVIAYGGG
jgi:ZIP family zinc transporter